MDNQKFFMFSGVTLNLLWRLSFTLYPINDLYNDFLYALYKLSIYSLPYPCFYYVATEGSYISGLR